MLSVIQLLFFSNKWTLWTDKNISATQFHLGTCMPWSRKETWFLESDAPGQFLPLWIAIHAIKEDSSPPFFLFPSLLHPSACLSVFLVFSCLAMNFEFFTQTKIKNLPTLVVIWILYFSFPWGIILHLHLKKKELPYITRAVYQLNIQRSFHLLWRACFLSL